MRYLWSRKRIELAGKATGFVRNLFVLMLILIFYSTSLSLNQITSFKKLSASRIQLTGTEKFNYHAFMLKRPARLILDIKNGHWLHSIKKQNLVDTPIKDIRIGYHTGRLRVVFDLKGTQIVNVFPRRVGQSIRLEVVFSKKKSAARQRPVFYSAFDSKKFYDNQKKQPSYPEAVNIPLPGRGAKVIILIDPGHGGKDPGATGPYGVHEKKVVLAISKYLYRDINRQPGFVAKLTRKGDYYLTLRQRLAIARRAKADMFIAIHADAYRNRGAHGASVYALSKRGATSEAARWIAQRENESELMGGVDLNDKNNILRSVLINLSQTATIRSSLQVGQRITSFLGNMTSLHHSRVEQAAFVVLKSPDIPSLLVETGFISNPYEERRLNSRWYQQKIASALMQGIRSYFVHSPPRGTWLSLKKFKNRIHFERYVVRRGDTLSGIAERHNVSVKDLVKQNHLHSEQIRIGMVIKIPALA